MPITGLENITKIRLNVSLSFRPSIALLMMSMPNIRIAKPIKMVARFFWRSRFAIMFIKTPTHAKIGVNEVGLKILIQNESPLKPDKLSSQDVTVVPTFAPKMMPMVCDSFIMPEFTKPTSITVVADELWMIAVTAKPSRKPLKRFEVRRSKMDSS